MAKSTSPKALIYIKNNPQRDRICEAPRGHGKFTAPRRLVDGLDADDIAIIDVAADCLDLCRIDLKKPLLPLSRVSLGSDGLTTSGLS